MGMPMLELQSPQDTRGFVPCRIEGVEAWRDPQGTLWVRARADEPARLLVHFTRIPGLPPLRLVPHADSTTVRASQRQARRAARELRKRGYA